MTTNNLVKIDGSCLSIGERFLIHRLDKYVMVDSMMVVKSKLWCYQGSCSQVAKLAPWLSDIRWGGILLEESWKFPKYFFFVSGPTIQKDSSLDGVSTKKFHASLSIIFHKEALCRQGKLVRKQQDRLFSLRSRKNWCRASSRSTMFKQLLWTSKQRQQ